MILLKNIGELVTFTGNAPVTGEAMQDMKVLRGVDLLMDQGSILEIGENLEAKGAEIIDCTDKLITPGYIDSHTHLVYGGNREDEYRMRLRGASYVEIMEAGGGIIHSVSHTREASEKELLEKAQKDLLGIISQGITTVEAKSGYGLDKKTELKQLRVLKQLQKLTPVSLVSTFMGAHALPEEYEGRAKDFLNYLADEVLPVVREEELATFVDIFTEKGIFEIEESRRYMQQAKDMGFKLKFHADEIVPLDGAVLAGELGAVSADHLLKISEKGISALKESGTIATLLPMTAFSLKEDYAPARRLIDSGLAVALATDYNPGSCHSYSIPLIIALATLNMSMSIEETLAALTINAACACGVQDQRGTLEVGKKADLLIHHVPNVNFIPYYFGVNTVNQVIKDGRIIFDRSEAYV